MVIKHTLKYLKRTGDYMLMFYSNELVCIQ